MLGQKEARAGIQSAGYALVDVDVYLPMRVIGS